MNTPNPSNTKYPLQPLCERWQRAMAAAKKDRQEKFDKWADEASNFFDGPPNWMWSSVRSAMQSAQKEGHSGFLAKDARVPTFQMSVNRLFEAVAMFGPVLYHQNPTIAVTGRDRPAVSIEAFYQGNEEAQEVFDMIPAIEAGVIKDPAAIQTARFLYQAYNDVLVDDQRAKSVSETHARILESASNFYQQEGSKQDEARLAITEAIITGLGVMEIVVEESPTGGPKIPRSRFRTNKDLLVDPDAKYWRDVTWIALRSCAPVNQVEEQYGLKPGSLKGKYARKAAREGKSTNKRHGNGKQAGVNHDIVEYWEIYSKNGAGQHLKLNEKDIAVPGLEVFGDFVKLVIVDDVPFPLNLAPQVLNSGDAELILDAASWEVPYWDDFMSDGGWPIVRLSFYNKPGCIWPISMVKPCIGELRFINWCMSFIADKVSGDQIYVGVLKEAAENIRQQLMSNDGPYSIIELEKVSGRSISDLISFMQSPNFGIDIWNMVAQVNEQIDKRLGLIELLYGLSGRQMRSAAEAQYRQSNINIRPDDMASRVEDWLSLSATREIQAMRYLCDYEDVEPFLGPTAAQVYATQILTDDVTRITRDFKFRVEAGTARKPNKDTKIAQLVEMGQYVLPVMQQAMLAGITGPFNAYMTDMGRAMDIDPTAYLLTEEDQQMLIAAAMPEPTMEQGNENSSEGETSSSADA